MEIRGKGTKALPGLLDRLRDAARMRHHGFRTELACARCVSDFTRHHGFRHPPGMGEAEIAGYLIQVCTHVPNRGGLGVISPADGLLRGEGA